MRHLSFWHLNYDKIATKGGTGLTKVVSVQKFQIVIAMTIDNAVSQSASSCKAFDIVFII